MGRAAAEEAATKSWHGAMEMIVDGFREVARPWKEQQDRKDPSLALSRTPTLEVDIVCDSAEQDLVESEAVVGSATGSRRRRLLRFGGVFRRTGGRLRESSMSLPITSWLGKREGVIVGESEGRTSVLVGQKSLQSSPIWATSEFGAPPQRGSSQLTSVPHRMARQVCSPLLPLLPHFGAGPQERRHRRHPRLLDLPSHSSFAFRSYRLLRIHSVRAVIRRVSCSRERMKAEERIATQPPKRLGDLLSL